MRKYKENKRKNRREGMWILLIFGIITIIFALYISTIPMETTYDYSVKAEQVYDNDKVSESTKLQDLSEDEKAILFTAFKKSDHFLDGADVTIRKDEKLQTFNDWKVIEYQGVYLLVAIEGPDSQQTYASDSAIVAWMIGICFAAVALTGLKMVLFPSRYRW